MRVLVATDLSDAADVAIREAAGLALKTGDALAVAQVLMPGPVPDTAARKTDLRDRVLRVCGRKAEVFVEAGIETEYAAIVHRADAWHADLVVIGSRGRSGVAPLLGGVDEAVARNAHCNVLVARAQARRGWVLAATDLSDASLVAIPAAAAEARRRGARLEVVRALGFLEVEARYVLTPLSTARTVFDRAAQELSESMVRLGVEGMCKVLDRPAAAAIVGEAEAVGAELIVVGARGRTGAARVALGSVSEKVVRAAACSVLIVRCAAATA
jgi:nucleotide-binding universal stress UspA family protein